jgi:hypothetical protein
MAARPSYGEIVVAYIEEGYRAWHARDEAWPATVVSRLGLSADEALDWQRELEGHNLIVVRQLLSAAPASPYRLSPRGLAFAERLPDLQRLMAQQTAAIDASAATPDEKRQAGFSLRAEAYKVALSKGVDFAIQNAPSIWSTIRNLYTGLPPDWKGGV